jgi:hypothetical protein
MKYFSSILLAILLSSCSSIYMSFSYKTKSIKDVEPVCTTFDGTNGAAYFILDDVQFRVEVYNSQRLISFGPILLPVVPAIFLNENNYSPDISALLKIEADAREDKRVSISIEDQELFYDDKKVFLGSDASYTRNTDVKGEIARGSVEAGSEKVNYKNPVRILIVGGRHKAPEAIKAIVKVKINNKVFIKELNFNYESDWSYYPFWAPTVHTDKICKKKLPNGKESFIY